MLKALIIILQLTMTEYHYEGPIELLEMVGHATNEYFCEQDPHEFNPSCVAHCTSATMWFSHDDVIEDIAVCEKILTIK